MLQIWYITLTPLNKEEMLKRSEELSCVQVSVKAVSFISVNKRDRTAPRIKFGEEITEHSQNPEKDVWDYCSGEKTEKWGSN